jgi:hypothetical protein
MKRADQIKQNSNYNTEHKEYENNHNHINNNHINNNHAHHDLQAREQKEYLKHEYGCKSISPYSFLHKVKKIIKDETKYKKILNDCQFYDTVNLDSSNNRICFACESELKEDSLTFYCYECEAFYCPNCEKSRYGEACLQHSLVTIVNYKAALKSQSLCSIEKYKFGVNLLKQYPEVKLIDTGFCCSYCDETRKEGARYICLNCRGCDVILHSHDNNTIGYIDVCEKCFQLINATIKGQCQDEEKNERVKLLLGKIMERDHHSFEDHIYIKLERQTGSYFIY